MATTANTRRKSTKADEVEIVDKETSKDVEVRSDYADGIYVEHDVELTNGLKLDIEVITDRDELPASFDSYMADGYAGAMIMAMMTVKTRMSLDALGATRKDLNTVIAPVIGRARKAAEAE